MVSILLIVTLGFYRLSDGADFQPGAFSELRRASAAVTPIVPNTKQPAPDTTPAQNTIFYTAENRDIFAEPFESRSLVGEMRPIPAEERIALGTTLRPRAQTREVAQVSRARIRPSVQTPQVQRVFGENAMMRDGPGTEYLVMGTLMRDSEVEVLQDPQNGWVKFRDPITGQVGWMAKNVLTKASF
ncbi:SH3 domain-containing protein [Cognatishimia maritima]|nr:SH3 domain-containing protein [Cognatishimia maritima]